MKLEHFAPHRIVSFLIEQFEALAHSILGEDDVEEGREGWVVATELSGSEVRRGCLRYLRHHLLRIVIICVSILV